MPRIRQDTNLIIFRRKIFRVSLVFHPFDSAFPQFSGAEARNILSDRERRSGEQQSQIAEHSFT